MAKNVAVVGAGIIGCSTAYHLSELLEGSQHKITLISERFTPYTTSDLSIGVVLPFDVSDPPCCDGVEGVGDITRWSRETIDRIQELYHSPDVVQIGLSHIYGCQATNYSTNGDEDPWWSGLTHGFRRLVDEEERRAFNIPTDYRTAFFFGMYIIDCREYLPWLMNNFQKNGGKVLQQKISNLAELASGPYDIIINCSGLGASTLVSDKELYPISGELVSVHAPWIKNFLFLVDNSEGSICVTMPRSSDVVLGVTAKENDWNDKSDVLVSQSLLTKCKEMLPGLESARVLSTWIGLRPCRGKIRLTCEQSSNSQTLIHCYGHGSKGVALHWGCALEIGRLVSKIL